MNKYIATILINAILIQLTGCYSMQEVTKEEIDSGRPSPEESIRLILNDGSKIECVPLSDFNPDTLYYLKVEELGGYIIGRGQLINMSNGERTDFNGSIRENQIDFTSLVLNSPQRSYAVWLKEKSNECILFKDGYYAIISPDQGPGYFLWKPEQELRKIQFNEIIEIQEISTNWYVVGSLIALSVAIVVGFAIFINEMNTMWK
jgi:hypothetical protein